MISLTDESSSVGLNVYDETILEPLVLLATLVLGALLIVVPRRHASIPFIVLACFLPVAQRLVIGGFDFTMIRLLLLFGWTRLFLRAEYRGIRWSRLDYAFFTWVALASIIWVLGRRDVEIAIQRAGITYTLVGLYVLFRCWLRDLPSVRNAFAACAGSIIVLAGFMTLEFSTGRNLFSIFGSVPEFTAIRDGRLRCQGTFSHPIMAGSVGATFAPLALWLLLQKGRGRALGALGFLGAVAVVVYSASSGPLLGLIAGLGAMLLWRVRQHLYLMRWGAVLAILALHLVMNRPVWHLIADLNVVGASQAYHRVALIDSAIREFSSWALLGIEHTAHWGIGMNDVTNQFILEGIRGGIWSMVAFIVLLFFGFRFAGTASRRFDRPPLKQWSAAMMCWTLGAVLLIHTVNFIGVSYFGQIEVFLMMHLAMIGGVYGASTHAARAPERVGAGASRVRALLRPTAA